MEMFQLGETNKTLNVYFVDASDNGIPISAATTKQIKVTKPSGEDVVEDASFISGGTTGGITFTIADADWLDEQGVWQIQGLCSGTGFSWKTVVGQFYVSDNL